MKKAIFFILLFAAAANLSAQTFTEWHDAAVNEINRLPMRASYFAYESAEAARKGDPRVSERFLDLDGTWKFSWVRNADQRPADFFRTDYDDRSWSTMPVPGLWELNGYGDPQYLNIGYAWREQFENNPPYVPIKENHVGSYRREIEIPASWSDKQVIARFGSVTSNIYLWVNGRFVGYSEDSKLECEFDITRFVKPGKNLFAFQVFRWCDGTYLEDQDFFRLSGMGRDCFLYARDKRHIADVRLDAALSENYTRGRLAVELALPAATRGCTAEVTLTDPDGKAVAFETAKLFGTIARLVLDAGRVQPWSAEIPALYGVTVTLKDPAGKTYCTVKLNNFRMLNLATEFYTFRHTAVLTSLQEPDSYTDENFGNINDNDGYVIDPYFFKKTVEGAKDFKNEDGFFAQALVQLNIDDSNWAGMAPANSWSRIYCLENCMFRPAQLNAYTTGVMFKASLDIATDRVFNESGETVSNPSNWPTNLFYFNYNFYTSVNAIRKLALNNLPGDITDNSTTEELAKYSIKRFKKTENYACYYNYWIKHEDNNNDTEMGVMEFGIVRNNIYRLSVNKVAGLGSGEPFIEPEQPDEYKAELNINIDVFPWAVRNQDVELE